MWFGFILVCLMVSNHVGLEDLLPSVLQTSNTCHPNVHRDFLIQPMLNMREKNCPFITRTLLDLGWHDLIVAMHKSVPG
jgi:hypothetical protein